MGPPLITSCYSQVSPHDVDCDRSTHMTSPAVHHQLSRAEESMWRESRTQS